mmetsp:Transcript_11370/g.22085  ORF Transcript_11370/g.22085 Transcript_11370/m.22085 type:complete len:294 (-) Transcript_11370:117-998(-)
MAVGVQPCEVTREQARLEAFMPVRRVTQRLGQRHHFVHLFQQQRGQAAHLGHRAADAAVMRDLHRDRLRGQQARDRRLQCRGIELHRRAGRQDPRPAVDIEVAVGQAEGIAGEPAAAALVPEGMVMLGMARAVNQAQRPAAEVDDLFVMRGQRTLRRHRHQLAIAALHFLLAIDGPRAQPQGLGVDQMAQAARMHQRARAGQGLHDQAHAAGMIQVHMGRDHPVHRVARQPERIQRRQQARGSVVGAGVDEGGMAVLDHQIGRIEARALEAGVDGIDAVAEVVEEIREHGLCF